MKDLIIIGHEPLSERLRKIFCIDDLVNRGVNVEYWDLSQYFYPEINIPDVVNDFYIRKYNDLQCVEDSIKSKNIENTIFVIEVLQTYDHLSFFKMLEDNKCYCVKIDLYANTSLPLSTKVRFKRILNLKNYSFKKIYFRFYQKYFQSNPYKQILSSSTNSNRNICINHPDYEVFLEDTEAVVNEDYILFLDVYYPLHPDLKYHLKLTKTSAVDYQSLMTKYFDFLENKYGKKVIIAAHPKSMYYGNEFGNRVILKNNTNNLVKYATFVVTHESNALSYISLSNIPFAIVYPDTYRYHKVLMDYIKVLASYCCMPLYNLDKYNWDDIEYISLNDKVREKYIYNFLTSKETEDKRNIDIIIDQLNLY